MTKSPAKTSRYCTDSWRRHGFCGRWYLNPRGQLQALSRSPSRHGDRWGKRGRCAAPQTGRAPVAS